MKHKNDIRLFFSFLRSQPKGYTYGNINNNNKPAGQSKEARLEALFCALKDCKGCPLATLGKTNIVWGKGSADAKLMFIGEGPGRDEDRQAMPFVGRAGQLLTKIIEAMGLKRSDVYISNVVKCRPPENRQPAPEESQTCKRIILFHEIEIIKPQIICTLGATATQAILGPSTQITKIRGNFFPFKCAQVMPTFHPAYLLRNPAAKKYVWEDIKKILKTLA